MGEPVFKVLLDTSVYIPHINQGIEHPILELREKTPLLYMSAVVMEELYAGAFDKVSNRLLDRIFRTFDTVDRMITPDGSDWQKAGKILAKLSQKYGFEELRLSRLLNDILIALSARKLEQQFLQETRKIISA